MYFWSNIFIRIFYRFGESVPTRKSIENFMNQDELIELMYKNNLTKCSYRNLTGGIVAIHSGWKI